MTILIAIIKKSNCFLVVFKFCSTNLYLIPFRAMYM